MNGIARIFDLLNPDVSKYEKGTIALSGKQNGIFYSFDIQQYIENSYGLAHAFVKMGILPGDRIATVINNRPEWNFFDMAIMLVGAIHVPVYPTISLEQYSYILSDAGIKAIVVNNQQVYDRLKDVLATISTLKIVICIDACHGIIEMKHLLEQFSSPNLCADVIEIASKVTSESVVSIIYTSGTTGRPKGVMLTHANMISNFLALSQILNQEPAKKALSVLPLCHIYERILNYTYQLTGSSIHYVESFDQLKESLQEAKPQIFCAVPRLLEKIYDGILAKGRDQKGIKKFLFFWSLRLSQQINPSQRQSIYFQFKLALARKLVFSKWHKALGGNLVTIVSGGASLNPKIARTFWAAGFKIMEGYGLTETSPVIAVSNFLKGGVCIGTVGKILEGVEIKFAPDGEILVRGNSVMKGYYNRPERTAEVIDAEGWFHTGDIGQLVRGEYLQITDRKKEMFKTSGGKYIAPQVLENRFKESPFIEHVLVVGEGRKFPAALVSPSFDYLRSYCIIKEIPYNSNADIIRHSRIIHRIEEEIYNVNQHFGKHEQIKRWELLSDSWSVESGELSPTLKLRRSFLLEKYNQIIEELYEKP